MVNSERVLGVVKDVVLPVDVNTRYDVYFTDSRIGIVCMGKADRFESDTQDRVSLMPSLFGVPAPVGPRAEKASGKPSIDEEVKGWSLDNLLKLSKKSCFYTLDEIEKIELVCSRSPKFVIMSDDCESKFSPDEEQFKQLIEVLPTIEALKDKIWIAGKWNALFDESLAVVVCKSCGASNDSDAVYCQSCGKKLEEETENAPASELTCSSCGAKNRAQASFCKKCGTAVR